MKSNGTHYWRIVGRWQIEWHTRGYRPLFSERMLGRPIPPMLHLSLTIVPDMRAMIAAMDGFAKSAAKSAASISQQLGATRRRLEVARAGTEGRQIVRDGLADVLAWLDETEVSAA